MSLALCAVALASSCGGRDAGVIVDPPVPVIDMNGTWRVTTLMRLGGTEPLPFDPGSQESPFRPLYEGMELNIAGDQVRDRDGGPLFADWNPAVANERYVNLANGIRVHFDWLNRGGGACTWQESVTLMAAPIDEYRMWGQVTIVSVGDCPDPAPLPPEASGVFQFVLQLVAQPAGASAAAQSAAAADTFAQSGTKDR